MDDISDRAGRLLADRYRLPQTLADSHQLTESVAYDTASGQEVLVRQVPLPEVVDAEVLGDGWYQGGRGAVGRATRTPADPAVRRALEAAQQAAALPDHPRLDQVFDVFVEGDGLWIVSELLPATPLAALLEHQTIGAHRAAEIAADLLTALRAVHAHGWTHGNVTPRTVLICDDGRALLTGLAVGAAQEALCGYDPLPDAERVAEPPRGSIGTATKASGERGQGGEGGAAGERAGGPALPGIALPEGFDEERRDDPYGPEPTVDLGLLRQGQDAPGSVSGSVPGSARGIFGLQGLDGLRDRDEGPGGAPGGSPGDTPGGTPRRDPGASPGAREEWWKRPSSAPSADDQHSTPDDYVCWLPAGEDEITPDELPAQRQPGGLPARRGPRPGEVVPGGVVAGGAVDGGGASGEAAPVPSARGESATGEAAGSAQRPGAAGEFRGPATALAAERARQARMTVVGAVGERWSPEQARPVHRDWQQGPPVGPAADLWALGVLLFRAVQGRAPYPEDDVAELVRLVCGEPPAFGDEGGVLRPVVEALLRQDPAQRPDFEELRGRLRSLVRAAPEPEAGWHTIYAPSLDPGGTTNSRRLPILRRRGELVRRRRFRRAARAEQRQRKQSGRPQHQQRQRGPQPRQEHRPADAPPPYEPPYKPPHEPQQYQQPPHEQPQYEQPQYGQAYQQRTRQPGPSVPPPPQEAPRQPKPAVRLKQTRPPKAKPAKPSRPPKPYRPPGERPRRLGAVLLGLVFVGLVAGLMYAVMFMPGDGKGAAGQQRGSVGGETREPDGSGGTGGSGGDAAQPAPSGTAKAVPAGYKLSRDPAGFQIAVPEEWNRRSTTGRDQVRYNGGPVEMVIVNGRDSVRKYGRDPMTYQSDHEPELRAYRASQWASTTGLRRIDVGATAMAEGTFSWKDGGREVYARNRAMIVDGRYHVLMVLGSESRRAEIDRHFESVADTYRAARR